MTRWFGLIGAPSSIGAHWPGQEKAPCAVRSQAGRVLAEAGLDEEGEAAAALVRGVMSAVAGKKTPEKSDGSTDIERG